MDKGAFVPFTSFFVGIDELRSEFLSYAALINASNAVIDFYNEIHNKNMFGGIDDECIRINPDSGQIQINRKNNNISLKYKAPELITGKVKNDNIDTDNFTLAVILFRMFFVDHPFEGKIDFALAPLLTHKISEMLYGYEPVFVYSPADKSNRPLSNLSPYLTSRWNKVPQPLRDAFTKTFTEGMSSSEYRLSVQEWKTLINKIMDTGVIIDGKFYTVNPDDPSTFPPQCVVIKIGSRKIALADGGKLIISYKETTTPLNADIFFDGIRNILVFENITDDTWIIYKSDGSEQYIQPKEKVYLTKGDCIDFGSESGKVL